MTLEKHRGRCPNTVLSLRCWRISRRPGARGWLLQRCSGQRLSPSRCGIWMAKKVSAEARTVVRGGRMIYGERNVMLAIKLFDWWSVVQAATRACPDIPEILSLAHLRRVRDGVSEEVTGIAAPVLQIWSECSGLSREWVPRHLYQPLPVLFVWCCHDGHLRRSILNSQRLEMACFVRFMPQCLEVIRMEIPLKFPNLVSGVLVGIKSPMLS